jgi:hypothetical protein
MASGQEGVGKGHDSVQRATQDTGCTSDRMMRGATTEALSGELVETVRQQVGGEGERNVLLYMYQRVADNEADNVAEARRWLTGRGGGQRPGV